MCKRKEKKKKEDIAHEFLQWYFLGLLGSDHLTYDVLGYMVQLVIKKKRKKKVTDLDKVAI